MPDISAHGFHHDDEILIGNTREELIAAVDTCLAHDALDCVPTLVAPMNESRMTRHKGRVITNDGGKP